MNGPLEESIFLPFPLSYIHGEKTPPSRRPHHDIAQSGTMTLPKVDPSRLGLVEAIGQAAVGAFRQGRDLGVIENRDLVLDLIKDKPAIPNAVSALMERGAKLLIPVGIGASVAEGTAGQFKLKAAGAGAGPYRDCSTYRPYPRYKPLTGLCTCRSEHPPS